GGYDGRGQVFVAKAAEAKSAWEDLAAEAVVAERALAIEAEISVLVARRPNGDVVVYEPALNHHEERVLAWSVLPGPIDARVKREAVDIARSITTRIDAVGLLVIEMFVVDGAKVLVNELAPRPHNSFHATEVACATSQFEQLVRAVCDLPLGSAEVVRPVAIANLLGDVFLGDEPPAFDKALELPGVRLHLYGKRSARPGRKMGHLSAAGSSPEEAVRLVQEAFDRIARKSG
ncbi:MAG: ATP-grasp domain-containing protein, partial [Polyangiaceae bacterium]